MVKLEVLIPGKRLVDGNGPRGMRTIECLSLREIADSTNRESAISRSERHTLWHGRPGHGPSRFGHPDRQISRAGCPCHGRTFLRFSAPARGRGNGGGVTGVFSFAPPRWSWSRWRRKVAATAGRARALPGCLFLHTSPATALMRYGDIPLVKCDISQSFERTVIGPIELIINILSTCWDDFLSTAFG